MARTKIGEVKLLVRGGQATPAPPIGPALGSKGINIGEFCKRFNDKTKDIQGKLLPVVINIYNDRTFDFVIKKPTVSYLLLEALKQEKGSSDPGRKKIGHISYQAIKKIAEYKMDEMNCDSLESAIRIVEGTALSMGIIVDKENQKE